jgi:hypothetical protein
MKRKDFADNDFSPQGGGGRFLRRTFLSLLGAAALAGPRVARAQLATNKTIRIIVPFAPSGSSDVLARVLQAPLQQELGQTIIVENRAGAGTNIGTSEVARAEPDGLTLLLTSSAFVVNPALYKSIPYDPSKDFAPIAALPVAPNVIAVNAKGDIKSLSEVVARQGRSGEAQLRKSRQRHDAAADDGAFEAEGGHPDHQYRLQRGRPGDASAVDRNGGYFVDGASRRASAGAGWRHARPCHHDQGTMGEPS